MPTCALLNTKYIRRHHPYTLQPLLVIQTLVDPAIQSSLSRNKTTCHPSYQTSSLSPQPASATIGFQRTFTPGRLIVYGLCSLRTRLASKRNPNASLHPSGVSALTTPVPCIKTCLHKTVTQSPNRLLAALHGRLLPTMYHRPKARRRIRSRKSPPCVYSCPNPTVSSTAIVSFWFRASKVLYGGRSSRLKLFLN